MSIEISLYEKVSNANEEKKRGRLVHTTTRGKKWAKGRRTRDESCVLRGVIIVHAKRNNLQRYACKHFSIL